ncbi:MAG: amidohydrolase family protein [Oscillospiraceae bacterium]|nr:amidohydrolase family protein [Oscillospiraceae bacterium]
MINWTLDYQIIDMHTHMGLQYCLYHPDHDADSMVRFMDEVGVEFIICSPCEDLFNGGTKRKHITEAMQKYPTRIRGYYGVNPAFGFNKAEMKNYVGFKLLPDYHRTEVTSDLYRPALEYADENKMIILSHTWGVSMNGESCNSADKIARILETYKNIKFIMGHSIQGQVNLAIELAKTYPNAYLDTCDTGRLNGVLEKMVRGAGAEKVVFGTDAPMQSYYYIMGAVLAARITKEERRLIFRDNALRIII